MGMRGENQPRFALPELPTLPGGKPAVKANFVAYLVESNTTNDSNQLHWATYKNWQSFGSRATWNYFNHTGRFPVDYVNDE